MPRAQTETGFDVLAVPGAEVWLAAAVHDLRDPLQSAHAHLKGIEDRFLDALPLVAQKSVKAALQAIQQSQELLDQTLACATAEDIHPTQVVLEDVVADVRSSLAPYFDSGDVTLVVRSLPTIHADPGGARRVIQHLVAHAAKHASGPVTVTISASRDRSGWWIRVQDDGPGIPPAILERLRDPAAIQVGSGDVGLALCRRIMVAHGGDMEFQSSPGSGTTLSVRWPDKPGRRTAAHRRMG